MTVRTNYNKIVGKDMSHLCVQDCEKNNFYIIFKHIYLQTYPRLISTFADAKQNPELRMAVFLLMLNSKPNFATMQLLANTLRREMTNQKQGPRSNQLASFVISHLFSLAYHSNVLMKTR